MNSAGGTRVATEPRDHGPSEHELLDHVLEHVKTFLAKNGLHVALVVGLLAVAVVGYRTLSLRHQTETLTQWDAVGGSPQVAAMLFGAEAAAGLRKHAIERCRDLLETEPKTKATPWLLLKLAGLYAQDGQWAAAADACRRLTAEYPESPAMAPGRGLLAVVLEQMGRYEEAAAAYEALAASGATRHLLSAGRDRELAGQPEAARELYRRLTADEVDDSLLAMARDRLADLAKGKTLEPPPELATTEPIVSEPWQVQVTVPEETPVASETAVFVTEPEGAPALPAQQEEPDAEGGRGPTDSVERPSDSG
ncbi:MAG: hypothetical protein AMK73_01385 [Planctomycetes bacterium SM23_32]|nr:MAG: hypothetical protein AMK73_01385 [Planctomycetes bacterium SM23_32]